MGNSGSITTNSYIVTDRADYVPGEQVTGTVVVDCPVPVDADEILITIQGTESVHWSEQRSTGSGKQRRTYTVHFREKRIIMNANVFSIDYRGRGAIVGQSSYPFSLILPTDLMGSCSIQQCSLTASVSYCISASFVKGNQILDQRMQVEREIHIRPNPPLQFRVSTQISEPVTVCCCFGKGKVDFDMYIEEAVVMAGGTLTLCSRIDNRSKKNVRRVIASVYEFIECTAQGRKKLISHVLSKVECDGINARTTDNDRKIIIPVPAFCRQSIGSGMLIKVSHCVALRVDVSFAGDPEASLPVHVFEPVGSAIPSPTDMSNAVALVVNNMSPAGGHGFGNYPPNELIIRN